MKTLGLIGGIGWESTARYYQLLNEGVRARCGSLFSARLLVNSLQFDRIDGLARSGQWNDAGAELAQAARTLEHAGAEGVVLCSNLMHFVAEHIPLTSQPCESGTCPLIRSKRPVSNESEIGSIPLTRAIEN